MKQFNYKNLLFNLVEFIFVAVVGYFIIPIPKMLFIIAIFTFVRETIGGSKHYKSPYKCMLWSFVVMESLFFITSLDFIVGVCLTIFAGILLSKGGDVAVFEYHNNINNRKYRELNTYIETNKDSEQLRRFEERLVDFNNKYSDRFKINVYEIYRLIFLEKMSYEKVKKAINLRDDNHIITNALDMVFICFDTYIATEEYYKKEESKELAKIS